MPLFASTSRYVCKRLHLWIEQSHEGRNAIGTDQNAFGDRQAASRQAVSSRHMLDVAVAVAVEKSRRQLGIQAMPRDQGQSRPLRAILHAMEL
jgi:hypothetical protein